MIRLFRFPDQQAPGHDIEASRLGGKGAALRRMAAQGVPVPPGIIVPSEFFTPWIDAITASRVWQALVQSPAEQWTDRSHEFKQTLLTLPLSAEQREALEQLQAHRQTQGWNLMAVRSSSPDEDQEHDAFAGLYETELGVMPAALEMAIRRCAASALDARLMHYKRERGLSPFEPRIAVIIQQQIASERSGVAFSINPATNDYDEALIEACEGLGEGLVSGLVTPDRWVVNKLSGEVIEQQLGSRCSAIQLDPAGGTTTIDQPPTTEACLTAEQRHRVLELLLRIEALMGGPVDVEWAMAGEQLYALQARAITTWIPVPEALKSAPGEQRTLYLDAALSKGFTTNQPISPLGLSVTEQIFAAMGRRYVGRWLKKMAPEDAFVVAGGGRLYAHLSNAFWLSGPQKMAASMALTDALVARTLVGIDGQRYRAARRPRWARWSALWRVPGLIWRMRALIGTVLGALLMPRTTARRHRQRMVQFETLMSEIRQSKLSLYDLMQTFTDPFVHAFMRGPVAVLGPALMAQQGIERLAGRRNPERLALAQRLAFGLSGNKVVEMNLAMSRLAGTLSPAELDHPELLIASLQQRTASAECLAAHDALMAEFGSRGPNEVDIAQSRYADDAALLIHQLIGMARSAELHDPECTHRAQQAGRAEALHQLLHSVGPIRRGLIRRLDRIVQWFGGERDTPKHQLVQFLGALRERALQQGQLMVEAGQLQREDDVFLLSLAQLQNATDRPQSDLERIVAAERAQMTRLRRQVRHFPSLIDSRGRIPRPAPSGDDPTLWQGMPISAGVVRGRVRIVHSPERAQIEDGEILVAYTTDPGWTPLFVSAAAIVLEVGGSLQHGAVVAREFGKPCVAGIDRVTTRLIDGQQVEVDGGSGTLRLLPD